MESLLRKISFIEILLRRMIEMNTENVRRYETIVLFDAGLGESQLKDEMKKVQTLLESNSAKDVSAATWGRKEISYKVKKQRFGNYVCFTYAAADPAVGDKLTGILRITDSVLKFQTHRLHDKLRKYKGNPKALLRKEEQGSDDFGDIEEI